MIYFYYYHTARRVFYLHEIFTFLNENVNGRTLHTGEMLYTLEDGGVLSLREDQALYRDQHSENGYRPVSFSADQRFYLQDGKLHFEYDAHSFDVDTATMTRAAARPHEGVDSYPTFHSVEK